MANIWVDKENGVFSTPSSNGAKFPLSKSSGRIHTAKKQAFGELKNVMNTTHNPKIPQKGILKKSNVFHKTGGSLYTEVLKKEQLKSNLVNVQEKAEKKVSPKNKKLKTDKIKSSNVATKKEEEDSSPFLLDAYDFPMQTCQNSCNANGLQDAWFDMNVPNDEFFERVFSGLNGGINFDEPLPDNLEVLDDKDNVYDNAIIDNNYAIQLKDENGNHEEVPLPNLDIPFFEDIFDFKAF